MISEALQICVWDMQQTLNPEFQPLSPKPHTAEFWSIWNSDMSFSWIFEDPLKETMLRTQASEYGNPTHKDLSKEPSKETLQRNP